jgi:hypothetical protein
MSLEQALDYLIMACVIGTAVMNTLTFLRLRR